MTYSTAKFETKNGLSALLDQVYAVKFSKHVPLLMIILFAFFAVWRTNHYVSARMEVGQVVSWSLAICIEMAMLAAGAACFISMREAYIRELKKEDAERAKVGVYTSFVMLGVTTLALLVLAGADGAMESNNNTPFVLLMLLIQFVQSCAILVFINVADLEERSALRVAWAKHEQQRRQEEAEQQRLLEQQQRMTIQQRARQCPYCFKAVEPNNRKRHIDACPAKPQA